MSRERPRGRVMPGRRRREPSGPSAPSEHPKLTDWVQALSGLIAVLFAIPALGVALLTYRDQQEINRSQLQLAQLEHEREARRFASRVWVWWLDEPSKDGRVQFKLQNAGAAPITPVYVEVTYEEFVDKAKTLVNGNLEQYQFDIYPSVPPCSTLTFALPPPKSGGRVLEADVRFPPSLAFFDGEDLWVTGAGVHRMNEKDDPPLQTFTEDAVEVPGTREMSSECGS
ncbi:hypothetical protein [Micromonospora taraxaci]|uniref:hypothetical protein n=1 Tax=Micromonospora taraxaci TaxID=1316803 RepID=UPI0033BAD175